MAVISQTPVNWREHGFFRVAVGSPVLRVADVAANVVASIGLVKQAAEAGAGLLVLPELGLTGYTCGDLFHQRALLTASVDGLFELEAAVREARLTVIAGAPWEIESRIYNAAFVFGPEGLTGIIPKTWLPTGQEYYERRWFASALECDIASVPWQRREIPFGVDLLFAMEGGPKFGVEICEDLWVAEPPSGAMALAGAVLIANLSASVELLGKSEYRRSLVVQQSARTLTAYAYAAAGPGESTTDVVFGGDSMIAENGVLLASAERFSFDAQLTFADVDLDLLRLERMRNTSFMQSRPRDFHTVNVACGGMANLETLERRLDPHPFVPAAPSLRAARCEEIFAIQRTGLVGRLRHVGVKRLVLGLSGGLDSTLALLVAVRAFDALGLPRKGILCVSMPGMGTTARTRGNAEQLAKCMGTDFREISIVAAVEQHFRDIDHDPTVHDVTYENSQARERTQVLMDLGNKVGGFVLGTGDLSEAALGWCTFNGDHMSMYHVNIGVPKTLVRWLVVWCAEAVFDGETARVLHDIADTPITPELLPTDKQGKLAQKTEETIGPYELHDYFLYHLVRRGFAPGKIAVLATEAFEGSYDEATVRKWLTVFLRRFFSAQFKRNSMPDGPKVGSVALSPRGDWRMPSDASATAWLTA